MLLAFDLVLVLGSIYEKIKSNNASYLFIKNNMEFNMDKDSSHYVLNSALSYCVDKIKLNAEKFNGGFPSECTEGGKYTKTNNYEWTPGFWTGQLLLAYVESLDSKLFNSLESVLESFSVRLATRDGTNTHDLGFLYSLSTVAYSELMNRKDYQAISLLAAELLIERYNEKTGVIQAWGDLSNPELAGRMIIDCTMNLPLLYWATRVTGNEKYSEIAKSHIDKANKYLVREDYSTHHTFYMDEETGLPLRGETKQGYSNESTWARGQAWAIYGFANSYRHTGESKYLETSMKCADYFIESLDSSYLPKWDLSLTSADTLVDSSAGAIAGCGLLELARELPICDPRKKIYEETALRIGIALTEVCLSNNDPECDGLLKHSVYWMKGNVGIDESCAWGDYFYLELLTKLLRPNKSFW